MVLTLREVPIGQAHVFVSESSFTTQTAEPAEPVEGHSGSVLYSSGLEANEGLRLRAGWAGRD